MIPFHTHSQMPHFLYDVWGFTGALKLPQVPGCKVGRGCVRWEGLQGQRHTFVPLSLMCALLRGRRDLSGDRGSHMLWSSRRHPLRPQHLGSGLSPSGTCMMHIKPSICTPLRTKPADNSGGGGCYLKFKGAHVFLEDPSRWAQFIESKIQRSKRTCGTKSTTWTWVSCLTGIFPCHHRHCQTCFWDELPRQVIEAGPVLICCPGSGAVRAGPGSCFLRRARR